MPDDRAAQLPASIVTFLELCLLAGLFIDFAIMAHLMTRHQAGAMGAHVLASLVTGGIFLPLAGLPYWLAVAVILRAMSGRCGVCIWWLPRWHCSH